MWSLEQWIALASVVAILLTALAGMTKAIADLLSATRKKDPSPAPQLGLIPSTPSPDDIDYRAYEDMKRDRDMWRSRALGVAEHLDEDTHPIDHKETP